MDVKPTGISLGEGVRRASPARRMVTRSEDVQVINLTADHEPQQQYSEAENVPFRFSVASEDSSSVPTVNFTSAGPVHHKEKPQASWIHAGGHTVTAVVGVGVLALPYTFSYLTWAGGLILLALSMAISLYTSYLLAALHQDESGSRRDTYIDLAKAILGERAGFWSVGPVQWTVMLGLCVTYMVTAGQSLQAAHRPDCSGHVYSGPGGEATHEECSTSLTWWIVAFSFAQFGLSQFKDFHSIWWISIVGAIMSACYSTIAFATSTAEYDGTASYGRRAGDGADFTFEVFNSLGTIMFAFGGHAVLLEIEATLATPPAPVVSMMKGLYLAYLVIFFAYFAVGIAGYAAFGNAVDADVLLTVTRPQWLIRVANVMVVVHVGASWQVFAQPVFEAIESMIARRKPAWAGHIPKFRWAWRGAYVVFTAALAISIPFFQALMGLVGALGFTPMTFVLPPILWQKAKGGAVPAWQRWLHIIIAVASFLAGMLAVIGSLRNIVVKIGQYHYGG